MILLGEGNLGVIVVRVCEPEFRNPPHSEKKKKKKKKKTQKKNKKKKKKKKQKKKKKKKNKTKTDPYLIVWNVDLFISAL